MEPKLDSALYLLFPYYRALKTSEKKRFSKRVSHFLMVMKFRGKGGIILTDQMKMLIAGAAIQMTFGLRKYLFSYYRRIYIMPDIYNIPELKEKLIGHVNKSRRSITLSWPGVRWGFEVGDDAHNVVLHEMAHVILFENTLRLRMNEFFSRLNWEHWLEEAEKEFILNQHRPNVLLSEYADKNLMEMFAVAIETFFEQPGKFKRHLPRLYDSLVKLLMQDPTNAADPCHI